MSYGEHIRIDLTQKGEVKYTFAPCNRLWLPKTLVSGDGKTIINNNAAPFVLGVKINDRSQPMQAWAILDGYVLVANGYMDCIYVTVLQPGEGAIAYLSTGTDIGLGYGNADGLSAQVDNTGGSSSTSYPAYESTHGGPHRG